MAGVISSVSSSLSGFSPMEDDGGSWGYVPSDNGSANSNQQDIGPPLGLNHSPSIVSQGSWAIVGAGGQQQRMFQTPSPVPQLDVNEPSSASFADYGFLGDAAAPLMGISNDRGTAGFDFTSASLGAHQQNPQSQLVINALQDGQALGLTPNCLIGGQNAIDFGVAFDDFFSGSTMNTMHSQSRSLQQHNILTSMNGANASTRPWSSALVQPFNAPAAGDFDSASRSSIDRLTPSSSSSIELSPNLSPSSFRRRQKSKTSKVNGMPSTKRTGRDSAKIRKPQKRKSSSPPLSSFGLEPRENPVYTFCNMNPDNWGKGDGNADVSRSSQKGRKGPLLEGTRANALAVRNKGACFCCHIRKVRCDKQRPCQNCVKSCCQVPQVVCWQFDDFTGTLFPAFIRKHFEKEEMSKFVLDNVQSFTLNGVEQPCTVTLSSGSSLMSKLVVKAKFFTAKTPRSDVMQHLFQVLGGTGADHVELKPIRSTPIGLDINPAKWNELRRKVGDYVHNIVQEPTYASELTASMQKTSLPRKMLQIMQRYFQQSNQSIVKQALSIYTLYYIMTRHLTLTQQSIESLRPFNPVRATGSYMTTRLLNRQIKAVIDDLVREKVDGLFDEFSRRLKTKHREEWAPCMAAFVVLCMLMEAIEAAADRFAISENEVEMRKTPPGEFNRAHALDNNKRIEDMPYKQFAFQFHQIYHTHPRDASVKSFNPLADDMNGLDVLDSAAFQMVVSLRDMLQTNCES
ncbi:hypothetical protein VP1G_06487 [Cytospora mali]|uniref:Zn(2)-C6 fungal-type domain-containing protein n=1 Tax=Cytospora mali TaxID=578113 RepID=A0A194V5K7_CYTMA|nr:hypothetical protein VP1G_06487 [Valsa mali var. pyri (nom. inval.)]